MNKRIALLPAFTSLIAIASSCTGSEDPLESDPPSITLLSPEQGVTVREHLAVAGTASGLLVDVSVVVDSGAPVPATGLHEWFHLVDVSALDDGSHAVRAIAMDEEDRVAESVAISFTSTANQPPDTSIWSGYVRSNDQQPLPGATVTVFGTTRTTTADLNARYAMVGLDPETEALLVGSHAGYADTYLPRLLPTNDIQLDIPLFTEAALDFVADQYDVVRTPGLATVIGFLLAPLPSQQGQAGATLALTGGSSADGPFYTTPTGGFDPDLTQTSSSGVFAFFNVPLGPVAVTASGGGLEYAILPSEAAADSLTLLFGRAF